MEHFLLLLVFTFEAKKKKKVLALRNLAYLNLRSNIQPKIPFIQPLAMLALTAGDSGWCSPPSIPGNMYWFFFLALHPY